MLDDGAGGGHPIREQGKDQKQQAKFKLNLWYGLSLRIIALFVTAIIVSYTPELFSLRDIFGDKPYPDDGRYHRTGFIDEEWNWGYRHYLYFLMCLCLFIVQSVRLGMWIDKNKDDFKP
jgi:hypothetical protein